MEKFWQDKAISDKVENKVADLLKTKYKLKNIEFNHDNKYDISAFTQDNRHITFEVKSDSMVQMTGNIGLEYFNRGKPSGIATSQSDYYVYHLQLNSQMSVVGMIKTKDLKKLIQEKKYLRDVEAGDGKLAKVYLFKAETLLKEMKIIFKGYYNPKTNTSQMAA